MNNILHHQPDSAHCMRNRSAVKISQPMAGFTMIELIITVVIAGILASLAIPAFSGLMAEQRAKAVATDLVIALTKARSEAVKRNANVTLAANAGGWQNGWQITDTSSNILENHGAVPTAIAISAAFTGTGPSVIYQSSGRLHPTSTGAVSFTITSTQSASGYRCVTTDLGGRPNTKKTSPCP